MKKVLPCCGCGAAPRAKNQRYCRNCHNEVQKKSRVKCREELLSLRKSAKDKGAAH
jgi:hypothetical protein